MINKFLNFTIIMIRVILAAGLFIIPTIVAVCIFPLLGVKNTFIKISEMLDKVAFNYDE